MARKSITRAQQLADRYNKQVDQVEALLVRVENLKRKSRETYSAAFAALPDGWAMQFDSDSDVTHMIPVVMQPREA